MGNSLSSLVGVVSLFGAMGLAMAAAGTESDWLQQLHNTYFDSDGSVSLLPIFATVVAGLFVLFIVRIRGCFSFLRAGFGRQPFSHPVQINKLRSPKNLAPRVPYTLPIIGRALEMADPISFLSRAHAKVLFGVVFSDKRTNEDEKGLQCVKWCSITRATKLLGTLVVVFLLPPLF